MALTTAPPRALHSKRIVALATQKFVYEVVHEAMRKNKMRGGRDSREVIEVPQIHALTPFMCSSRSPDPALRSEKCAQDGRLGVEFGGTWH